MTYFFPPSKDKPASVFVYAYFRRKPSIPVDYLWRDSLFFSGLRKNLIPSARETCWMRYS